ncbi:isoamylase early set domain-containing protein, partial [Planctomycetota bacterium]
LVFTVQFPEAKEVFLAGDFNSWRPEANPMQRLSESGIWQARIRPTQDRHEYLFVVDGTWHQDPHNKRRTANEYGGYNSVVEVLEHIHCLTGMGSSQLASVAT